MDSCLAKLFATKHSSAQMQGRSALVFACELGPEAVLYANEHRDAFEMQCEFRELFAGPLAGDVQFVAPTVAGDGDKRPFARATLLADCIKERAEEPPASVPTRACVDADYYYADVCADNHAIKVAREEAHQDHHVRMMMEATIDLFKLFEVQPFKMPTDGSRAICSREDIAARMREHLVIRAGASAPDRELLEVFSRAGTPGFPYCVAGGFVSKLADPSASERDFARADVDIFVYGPKQESVIGELIRSLCAGVRSVSNVRGSVVTLYRMGAMRVQIISSAYDHPIDIVAHFDCSHVKTFWSRGTIWMSAPCVAAFARRVSVISRTSHNAMSPLRIVKATMAGFHLALDPKCSTDVSRLCEMFRNVESTREQVANHLANVTRADASSDPMEFFARIAVSVGNAGILRNNFATEELVQILIRTRDEMPTAAQIENAANRIASECDVAAYAAANVANRAEEVAAAQRSTQKQMVMRSVIGNYHIFDATSDNWRLVDVRDSVLPPRESYHAMPLIIAGFKAAIKVRAFTIDPARPLGESALVSVFSQDWRDLTTIVTEISRVFTDNRLELGADVLAPHGDRANLRCEFAIVGAPNIGGAAAPANGAHPAPGRVLTLYPYVRLTGAGANGTRKYELVFHARVV